jgi:hypothetical protein
MPSKAPGFAQGLRIALRDPVALGPETWKKIIIGKAISFSRVEVLYSSYFHLASLRA